MGTISPRHDPNRYILPDTVGLYTSPMLHVGFDSYWKMSPCKQPPTLKGISLSISSTYVWGIIETLCRKWRGLENKQQCQLEARNVSAVLFDKMPSSVQNELTNQVIRGLEGYDLERVWYTWYYAEFELQGGELPSLFDEASPQFEADELHNEGRENYELLRTRATVCLRLLFGNRKVTRLELSSWLWNKLPYCDVIVDQLPHLGPVLESFITTPDVVSSITPSCSRLMHTLCNSCPNIRELSIKVWHFCRIIRKLKNLEDVYLAVDLQECFCRDETFSELKNFLTTNNQSQKRVRLKFVNENTRCLRSWLIEGTVVRPCISYCNTITEADLDLVSRGMPNLRELSLLWKWAPTSASFIELNKLSNLRLERFTLSDFDTIDPPLLTFLRTQSTSLVSLSFIRMSITSVDAVLSVGLACPHLEELHLEFKSLSVQSELENYGSLPPDGGHFRCLRVFEIKSETRHLKPLFTEMLKFMFRMPRKVILHSFKEYNEQEFMDRLVLRWFLHNNEIESLRVGYALKIRTVQRLMVKCGRLKELSYNMIGEWEQQDSERETIRQLATTRNKDFQLN